MPLCPGKISSRFYELSLTPRPGVGDIFVICRENA
jgi:hypothetical protein